MKHEKLILNINSPIETKEYVIFKKLLPECIFEFNHNNKTVDIIINFRKI